jgi:hypothetical protein
MFKKSEHKYNMPNLKKIINMLHKITKQYDLSERHILRVITFVVPLMQLT